MFTICDGLLSVETAGEKECKLACETQIWTFRPGYISRDLAGWIRDICRESSNTDVDVEQVLTFPAFP